MSSRAERSWMVRKLKPGEKDDGTFDLDFWERAGAEARWQAAFEMLEMLDMMRGRDPIPARLDRSICRVERR